MLLAEIRDRTTGTLLRTYDVTDVVHADGVQWAIEKQMDHPTEVKALVIRDEPEGPLTDVPVPLASEGGDPIETA